MTDGDLALALSDLNARIRILENKYTTFGERLLVVNQNMIEEYKKMSKEIRSVNADLKELKIDLFRIKEVIEDFAKEMEGFAKKENLRVLEKYINLWSPMNFVTEKEVVKLIESRGAKIGK